jgi:2'-5' RNA ligase
MNADRLFFIALLPPPSIQDYATEIKNHFAQRYGSRHALKSPPHITLQPPFKWIPEKIETVQRSLQSFSVSQAPIPITLEGFSAFPPRVIYINVQKTESLLALHHSLIVHLEATLNLVDAKEKSRSYAPHMTVAFRDLTKQNFRLAWQEFRQRSLSFQFSASQLTLLMHDGQQWNVHSEFPFGTVEREH